MGRLRDLAEYRVELGDRTVRRLKWITTVGCILIVATAAITARSKCSLCMGRSLIVIGHGAVTVWVLESRCRLEVQHLARHDVGRDVPGLDDYRSITTRNLHAGR